MPQSPISTRYQLSETFSKITLWSAMFSYALFVIAITLSPVPGLTATSGTIDKKKFEVYNLQNVNNIEHVSSDILSVKRKSSLASCGLSCLNKRGCVTAILNLSEQNCFLLKNYLTSVENHSPTTVQDEKTKMIVLIALDPCSPSPCAHQRECLTVSSGFQCVCRPDEIGDFCEAKVPETSCKNIKLRRYNESLNSGKYMIHSMEGYEVFTAYCDMEFDGGGWTRIARVVPTSTDISALTYTPVSIPDEYNALKDDENYVMTREFLTVFRQHSKFKQFRFECTSVSSGRSIHIRTYDTNTEIVDYFVGKSDVRPTSCNSYFIYFNDNSNLMRACNQWDDSKWGWKDADVNVRVLDHPMSISKGLAFLVSSKLKRFECDSYMLNSVAVGDFWNVYVR